ncbi:MAG: hypothetical protein JOS17DRAFT_66145 [Linnemannia elongata]|nr:MAG: hypothetical protein JOS17DRAFT_66145 [Linnemannia elongata]
MPLGSSMCMSNSYLLCFSRTSIAPHMALPPFLREARSFHRSLPFSLPGQGKKIFSSFLFVCLSVCLSVSLSVCCMSAVLSVCPSCLSVVFALLTLSHPLTLCVVSSLFSFHPFFLLVPFFFHILLSRPPTRTHSLLFLPILIHHRRHSFILHSFPLTHRFSFYISYLTPLICRLASPMRRIRATPTPTPTPTTTTTTTTTTTATAVTITTTISTFTTNKPSTTSLSFSLSLLYISHPILLL